MIAAKPKTIQLLCFAIGLVLFAVMFQKIGVQTVTENLQKTGWNFLIILIPSFFSRLFATLSQYYLVVKLEGKGRISFPSLFSLMLTSVALRDAMPFLKVGGEVYKGYVFSKSMGVKSAADQVLNYNLVYVLGHVALFYSGAVLSVIYTDLSPWAAIGLVAAISLVVYIMVWLITHALEPTANFPLRFIKSKARREKYQTKSQKVVAQVERFLTEVRSHPRVLFNGFLIYFFSRALECLEIFLVLKFIGVPIEIGQCLMIEGAATLINNMFFFFPYSAGVKEGGLYALLRQIGLSPSLGVYISVVARIRMLIWIAIGLVLMVPSMKRGLKFRQMQPLPSE